jgi:hypothetical protein
MQESILARLELAKKRLQRVLGSHGIAMARTLEQKIADAGPFNQRVDPHVLTKARKELEMGGIVKSMKEGGIDWYHLSDTDPEELKRRLEEQQGVHAATMDRDFTQRLGQAAEIAFYRALLHQEEFAYFGGYGDLEEHDDGSLYSKEEPPSTVSGLRIPGKKKLDFLLMHKTAGAVGVEVKNVREWFYPDREGVREMLQKCVAINAVPVLVARRIPYAAFSVLNRCGVLIHQFYGQVYPNADAGLAEQSRNKRLLGYHDIRVGNQPDARMLKFVGQNLPKLVEKARQTFDIWEDEIGEYASGEIEYKEFVSKLRGDYGEREESEADWEPEPPDWW